MAKTEVILSLDAALLSQARAAGGDLSATVDAALRRYLDRSAGAVGSDRRWAEDNALALEALAGGAEEVRGR